MRMLVPSTLALALLGCGSEHPSCCAGDPGAAAALPETSLYHLASDWTDQDARARKLESLRGTVHIAAMVFTSCSYACPRTLADLQAIEARLPAELRPRVRFVLVSLDPARDTPEVLRAWSRSHGLDPARWTLLRGSEGDVRELAAVLGVRYARLENGDYSHSNLIAVLDAQGCIVHRQIGLGADPAETLRAIESTAGSLLAR